MNVLGAFQVPSSLIFIQMLLFPISIMSFRFFLGLQPWRLSGVSKLRLSTIGIAFTMKELIFADFALKSFLLGTVLLSQLQRFPIPCLLLLLIKFMGAVSVKNSTALLLLSLLHRPYRITIRFVLQQVTGAVIPTCNSQVSNRLQVLFHLRSSRLAEEHLILRR